MVPVDIHQEPLATLNARRLRGEQGPRGPGVLTQVIPAFGPQPRGTGSKGGVGGDLRQVIEGFAAQGRVVGVPRQAQGATVQGFRDRIRGSGPKDGTCGEE